MQGEATFSFLPSFSYKQRTSKSISLNLPTFQQIIAASSGSKQENTWQYIICRHMYDEAVLTVIFKTKIHASRPSTLKHLLLASTEFRISWNAKIYPPILHVHTLNTYTYAQHIKLR